MKIYTSLAVFFLSLSLCLGQSHTLLFKTDYGDFKVVLYDFTPKHKELMLNAIKDSVYKDALFNRIISGFVVQGGEHDVDIAQREANDPNGIKSRLAPEFDERAFHKLGALGAGRDNNPEKASFLNQIYFVVGDDVNESDLDKLVNKKGIKFTPEQRESYLRDGGLPRLDGDYTVFGEVVEGMQTLKVISQLATDENDYPLQKVKFKVTVIK